MMYCSFGFYITGYFRIRKAAKNIKGKLRKSKIEPLRFLRARINLMSDITFVIPFPVLNEQWKESYAYNLQHVLLKNNFHQSHHLLLLDLQDFSVIDEIDQIP